MSEKLSEETKALMGTFAAAEAALAEAAAVWRQFRQPRVDTAAGHKKADAMEREAQFRLANAALLWLWHVEENAARAEARPAPVVDREAVALLERTASWIEATIPRLTDLDLRAEAARDADALRALLSPATSPGEGSSGAESARTGTLPVLTEGQHSAGGGKIPGVEEVIRYLRNYGPGTPDTTDLYFMRWAADHLSNLVSREAFWRSQAQTSEAG